MAISLGLFLKKKNKKPKKQKNEFPWKLNHMIYDIRNKRVHKYKMDKIYKVTIL